MTEISEKQSRGEAGRREGMRGWRREGRAKISRCVEFGRRGGGEMDGWMDGDVSALCLAVCQISALMEIPSAAEAACLCPRVVDTQADFIYFI